MTPEAKNYVEMNQNAEFGQENQNVIEVNTELLGYADFEMKEYLENLADNLNKEIAEKYDVSFMDGGDIPLNDEEVNKMKGEITKRIAEFNNQITNLVEKHTKNTFLNEEDFLTEVKQSNITLEISDLNNEKIHAITAYAQGLGTERKIEEARGGYGG